MWLSIGRFLAYGVQLLLAKRERGRNMKRILLTFGLISMMTPGAWAANVTYDSNVNFTGGGDFHIGGNASANTLEFTEIISAISGGSSNNLVNLGDMDSVLLGSITLDDNNDINCPSEC